MIKSDQKTKTNEQKQQRKNANKILWSVEIRKTAWHYSFRWCHKYSIRCRRINNLKVSNEQPTTINTVNRNEKKENRRTTLNPSSFNIRSNSWLKDGNLWLNILSLPPDAKSTSFDVYFFSFVFFFFFSSLCSLLV